MSDRLAFARAAYEAVSLYDPQREPCDCDLTDNTNLWGVPPAAEQTLRTIGASSVTRYPTYTGDTKESPSTKAVTTRPRAWRVAAAPAHASMSFMISPPCTLPYGFASDGSIVRAMTVFELETVLPGAMPANNTHTSRHVSAVA